MSDEFPSLAGSVIEAIRINAVTREVREGRALLIKRRRVWSAFIARVANAFFCAARYPAFVWNSVAQWQRWEVDCFNLLHAEQYCAFPDGSCAVCTDILPGASLAEHFFKQTFVPEMLDAAARELRRAHELQSDFFAGPWSHGDANLANFLFAAGENRARLIDFELVHQRTISAEERHALDLLAFLQDLLGCAREEDWLPFAERFIGAYGRDAAVDILRKRLVIPRGVPRLWWWIRTNYISAGDLRRRLSMLRWALG